MDPEYMGNVIGTIARLLEVDSLFWIRSRSWVTDTISQCHNFAIDSQVYRGALETCGDFCRHNPLMADLDIHPADRNIRVGLYRVLTMHHVR